MKKLICIVSNFLFLLVFLYAGNEPVPFRKKLKTNDAITLTGNFVVFNGSQPNLRFVTEDKKIVGIGKDENYCNEIVEDIIQRQIKTETIYQCEVSLKYIDDVNIPYYEQPLMCFTVNNIKIINCFIDKESFKVKINILKYDSKTRKLKCKIKISNLINSSIDYSNMFLNLTYEGKVYRAYMDSPTSNIIDFNEIEIHAHDKFEGNVYFLFEDIIDNENINLNKIEILYIK